ncbi:MAG: hypothetical protein M1819_003995 [Sarea resinae]|nr:MAG: hypothetical protein M1819_003995 [Sarea resinae]
MPSATDVVTYVGVPLAVLGVMPILYTSARAVLTVRGIRRELHANGIFATTRGSLMSGVVEIEIHRNSIIPLDRHDPAYWQLSSSPSVLKGGSWTTFNWNALITGHKLYRLQYRDELSQPQAEIDFEELVAFLLDRGAKPSKDGFRMLRTSGLWTPSGTKLLLSPDTQSAVLRVAVADDSDGVLSLSVHWRKEWDARDRNSLPPYWMRLERPEMKVIADKIPGPHDQTSDIALPPYTPPYTSIRIHLGTQGLTAVFPERKHELLPEPDHAGQPHDHLLLQAGRRPTSLPGLWFACAATALSQYKGTTTLWSYTIPDDLRRFAERDSVPCGVMVLLGVIDEADTPTWATPVQVRDWGAERHQRFLRQCRAMEYERTLPPDQQEAARRVRTHEQMDQMRDDSMREMREAEELAERRTLEALKSPRLDIGAVARANLAWLRSRDNRADKGKDGGAMTTPTLLPGSIGEVVEDTLFSMIFDEALAGCLTEMLDRWKEWSDSGGMNRAHLEFVKTNQMSFTLASCVLWLLREGYASTLRHVTDDLQECIKVWQKVRLG